MNSNYNGDFRPSRKRSTIPAPEKKRRARPAAWKVLVTVFLMVLSMAIVLAVLAGAFGVLSWRDLIRRGGEVLEPSTGSDGGHIDPNTGMPTLTGQRREKVFNFLICGLNDDTGNNTDTIMLAQFNTDTKKINVVQIPRDTYINADYNFSRINSIFAAHFNRAEYGTSKADRRTEGMKAFTTFVETAFACKIDYYVLVDLSAFMTFIDDIGGLKVRVPCNMDYEDPEQDLHIHLKAGEQTLSGYDAMCLVRNRHTYVDADYGRMNVQKIFMSALLAQMKEKFTDVGALQSIVRIAFNNVTTNLTGENCIYFATQMLGVQTSDLTMLTMPNTVVGSHLSILKLDAVDVVNNYLNVYIDPISQTKFDSRMWLTNVGDNELYTTYTTARTKYDIFTADQVNEQSIKLNTFD